MPGVLVAVKHTVGIVLLRFMPQEDHRIPLGGDRRVVVILLLRSGDAVAEKGQRQIKLARTASRQRCVVTPQLQRDHPLLAVWPRRTDQLGVIRCLGAHFCLQGHLKRLPAGPRNTR